MTHTTEPNDVSTPSQMLQFGINDVNNALQVLLVGLLEYGYLPNAWEKDNRWKTAILAYRYWLEGVSKDNPSLLDEVSLTFDQHYADAVKEAEKKSGDYPHQYPQVSPWTFEQVMDENYLPEPAVKHLYVYTGS